MRINEANALKEELRVVIEQLDHLNNQFKGKVKSGSWEETVIVSLSKDRKILNEAQQKIQKLNDRYKAIKGCSDALAEGQRFNASAENQLYIRAEKELNKINRKINVFAAKFEDARQQQAAIERAAKAAKPGDDTTALEKSMDEFNAAMQALLNERDALVGTFNQAHQKAIQSLQKEIEDSIKNLRISLAGKTTSQKDQLGLQILNLENLRDQLNLVKSAPQNLRNLGNVGDTQLREFTAADKTNIGKAPAVPTPAPPQAPTHAQRAGAGAIPPVQGATAQQGTGTVAGAGATPPITQQVPSPEPAPIPPPKPRSEEDFNNSFSERRSRMKLNSQQLKNVHIQYNEMLRNVNGISENIVNKPGERNTPLISQQSLDSLMYDGPDGGLLTEEIIAFRMLKLQQLQTEIEGKDPTQKNKKILPTMVFEENALQNNNLAGPFTIDSIPYELIIPINESDRNHWTLVKVTINQDRTSTITYFDSQGGPGDENFNKELAPQIDAWVKQNVFIRPEDPKEQLKSAVHPDSEPNKAIAECPLQSNGIDCGVFVCEIAKKLQAGEPLGNKAKGVYNIPDLRLRLMEEILAERQIQLTDGGYAFNAH